MAAVLVDGDVFGIFLEDDACVRGIAAARELLDAAALPCIADTRELLIRPRRAVLQMEAEVRRLEIRHAARPAF